MLAPDILESRRGLSPLVCVVALLSGLLLSPSLGVEAGGKPVQLACW
jgi:hypothetical protein